MCVLPGLLPEQCLAVLLLILSGIEYLIKLCLEGTVLDLSEIVLILKALPRFTYQMLIVEEILSQGIVVLLPLL